MLIDDVDLDNFVSKTILKAYHFSENIYVYNNAQDALNFLKQIKGNPNIIFPEVIFIDVNMPVIDGFQFIQNVQKELKPELDRYNTKLVMLTSSVFNSDRQKAKESFNETIFLVKPLTEETLGLI